MSSPTSRRATAEHLLDHEYDGIREFDNPTPSWWHAIFAGTVLFSLIYFVYFTFNPDVATREQSWSARQAAETRRLFASGDLKLEEGTLVRLMKVPSMMSVAEGQFATNCAQCHARDGGGLVGPNLTDDHYKNVKNLLDIYTVITTGAANGAMPAWKNNYSNNERMLLAAYVASMRGKTPAQPKAAEGDKLPAWPTITEEPAGQAPASPASGTPAAGTSDAGTAPAPR